MSILLSGDFHANADRELPLITREALVAQYGQDQFDTITHHIILGDAGFLWPGNEVNELKNYKVLSQRPFPILCVMGNHDPVLGRTDLPETDIGIGEKVIVVNKENPFVAYLKRGKVYTIENSTFLVLGGALSIDKEFRKPGKSWWPQEYWSDEEKDTLFKMLKNINNFDCMRGVRSTPRQIPYQNNNPDIHGGVVDYVLSHTGPRRINATLIPPHRLIRPPIFLDEVSALNEQIDSEITCKQWFCGHWHKDKYHFDQNLQRGYQYLYRTTVLLRG